MLNKVPEVTLYFWIIKILCTTVGETGSRLPERQPGSRTHEHDLVMSAVLVVALVFQFRLRRYVPAIYWLAVVLISVVGTLITDNLTDNFGVSLVTTTVVFSVVLALRRSRPGTRARGHSRSTRSYTTRREAFYWLTVLFTFALGTAAGDLTAERLAVGYWKSALLFAGADRASCYVAHLQLRAERDPRLLDRVHPHPAARRLDRRLPLAAAGRRRPRARHDRDERDLPRHDPRRGRLPLDDEGDRIEVGLALGAVRSQRSVRGAARPGRGEQDGGDPGADRGRACARRGRPGRVRPACAEPGASGVRPQQPGPQCGSMLLAEALPALEEAVGAQMEGRVATSPNAYDDIVEELSGGDYSEIILETLRATSRTGCTSISRERIAHLGYPLTTVAATH